MNPIILALASRYGTNKILQYLAQSSPALASKVTTALAYGYPAVEILKYVMKGGSSLSKDLPDASSADVNLYEKMGEVPEDIKTAGKVGLGALGIAGLGLSYALGSGQGAQQAAQEIAPTNASNIPQVPNAPVPTPPPTGGNIGNITPGQAIANQVTAPVQQAMQPATSQQIGQASQAIPTQSPTQQPSIFEQLLGGIDPVALDQPKQEQLKFLSMISDELQSKGKTLQDPEFKNLANKLKKTLAGKPGTVIEESARFQAGQEQLQVKSENVSEKNIITPQPITKVEQAQKGETVLTEDGSIAEIKGVSGNNFLIEENGKVRQVSMESLRAQPEAIKKAKIVFDPSSIPEDDRSAALAISLPMPDKSGIINMFHDGSFYLYKRKDGKPLDETLIKRITEGQDIPITSGDTYMGAWNLDKGDSRGSAAHKELTAMSQSLEDMSKKDDPAKQLTFEKITNGFTHGYLQEFMKLLKEATRNYNAKPKKQKKAK